MLHAEASASPTMHLQMDTGVHPSPTLQVPTVSHQVLEVPHCNSQMWGTTFWIDRLQSRFQGPQFFLGNVTIPGWIWRLATGKYQSPTLSATATLFPAGPRHYKHCLPSPFPFPQVALALWVQAPTSWKSLDSSQWSLSIFCHCCTGFLRDWTRYSCLRSIRRCDSYPHLQAWGRSPAHRAPSWWLSKTVEPLPWRSISGQSIVPLGIGCLVYETWQEFVSRRNDCSRWNRTVVVSTCTWQVKQPFCF